MVQYSLQRSYKFEQTKKGNYALDVRQNNKPSHVFENAEGLSNIVALY
jgi:hypothetical protein